MAGKYFSQPFDLSIPRDGADHAIVVLNVPTNCRTRLLAWDVAAVNLAAADTLPLVKMATADMPGSSSVAAAPNSRNPSMAEASTTTGYLGPMTSEPTSLKILEERVIPLGVSIPQTYQGDSLVGAGGKALALIVNGGSTGAALRVIGSISWEE